MNVQMSREELMAFACADPYREVVRNRFHQHDDQEFIGAECETREERLDRQHRERTEQALVDSADRMDSELIAMEKEDRAYREKQKLCGSMR